MSDDQAKPSAEAQELQDEQIEGVSGAMRQPAARITNSFDDEASLSSVGGTPGLA